MSASDNGAVTPTAVEPRPSAADFDHARIEAAVREILYAIGEDPDRDGLLETPARVARAYEEIVVGYGLDYSGRYRNLTGVATLARHVYS